MSFKVQGSYTVRVDEEYDDEAEAYARAREIAVEHESSGVYVDGEGVWAVFNRAQAAVEA